MRWLARFWRRPSLGERGESAAARYLRRHGYYVVARNLRLGDEEADLVAIDRDRTTLVIVEVKTRQDDSIVPEASVGARKQQRLTRLAARLKRDARYLDMAVRFDVVAVVWPQGATPTIRHSIAAFDSRI